jgi:asparagine synthase (glutamine-hydrolysing)
LEALPATIGSMSEPMMSHDAVGFFLLSKEVSKHVKVVQSGQGADEVFAGYHWYPKLLRSNDITRDYARHYFDRDHEEMKEALHPSLVNGDFSSDFIEDFFSRCNGNGPVDKTLQLDTEIMLVDDPVKRVDNMTMAWGLEGRLPFLDHELVELAARIPTDLKLRNGGKFILKEIARRLVPSEVIDRPKGYFPVPALKYLRGSFLEYVGEILHDPRARQRQLFNQTYVERLLNAPEAHLTAKGHSKLWQIAVMEQWLQCHGL